MNIRYIEMKNHSGGLTKLTVVVDGDKTVLGELVGKIQSDHSKYELSLTKVKKSRGLTANAYYWALVDKIARALETSKDDIHKELIQRYGVMDTKENGDPKVFSILAGEDPTTINPYVRPFAEGYVNGKRFIHYYVLKRSSQMSGGEFQCLLAGCQSEAKDLGIEVLTPKEIAELEYLNPNTTNYKEKQ